ncbi:DUF6668 family protein [Streptomyces sp. NPDC018045]|uniref:DUF6668 family protein n=1 Tax=Streptomyces sp. NPDC018045 TaxID=3365037 RepID=UPI0037A45875
MTGETPANTWVTTQQTAPPVSRPQPPAPDPSAVTGPLRPQPGAVTSVTGLPVARYSAPLTPGSWWLLGCHGGAGVTTLEQALPGGTDAQRLWPAPIDHVRAPVLLVARSHHAGLVAAQQAARQWAAGALPWVQLLGLVVVADAPGRPPKALRDLQRLVSGGVPRLWDIPWSDAWRCGEPPHTHPMRQVAVLGRDLAQTIGGTVHGRS